MGSHPTEEEAIHYGQPRASVPMPPGAKPVEGGDFDTKLIHYRDGEDLDESMD